MNRIRLLSEQTANQIAAGEVVERPASVVKELVENALDAGASRITVEIQGGGRSLIRVADDGIGMSRDDALLCLERHATSKISSAEELSAIASFGFRGEALPSIASVSRFTLTTRERGATDPEATQIVVQGGRIVEVRSAAGPAGTVIEARQLFFNLPARRKFLRTEETERAHIQHYLTLAAMAHPHVGFIFLSDQRQVWQLPPAAVSPDPATRLSALRERMEGLRGRGESMIAVDAVGELAATVADDLLTSAPTPSADSTRPGAALRLWGFLGAPGVSRATREDQHLFVNRRPIENRGLNFALLEGYHTALMKGRYPVCALFLEIDPAAVDVNIHPAKREVKFHQEHLVRRFVTQAVRAALLRWHAGSQDASRSHSPAADRHRHQPAPPSPPPAAPPQARPAAKNPPAPGQLSLGPEPNVAAPRAVNPPAARPIPAAQAAPNRENGGGRPCVEGGGTVQPGRPAEGAAEERRSGGSPEVAVPLLEVPLRLLGVVGRLYVVYESDRGMVLMDQHAAHERVLFEQMLRRLEQGTAPSQRLLLPETVELTPRDAQFLRENMAILSRLGVGLSEFGDRTFLLDGLPPFVRARDARAFVLEVIDDLKSSGQPINALRLGEHTIAKTVCRHAVKANDPLAPEELEALLAELRRCEMPYTCPHGRPTLIEMSHRELERRFGRAQA